MSEERGLIPAPQSVAPMQFTPGGFVITSFEMAWRVAQLFAKSELVPKDYRDKPENCLVAMQMGAELGLKPLQSLQGIAVINGRPGVWGDALWALVQSSPLVEDAFESYDATTQVALCHIKRRGRAKPTVQTFSMEDAKKAGLQGKTGPWTTNPRRMCQMRARAFAARDAVPDVLKGLLIAEEVADYVDLDSPERPPVPAPIADINAQVTQPAKPAPEQKSEPSPADKDSGESASRWFGEDEPNGPAPQR